MSKRKKLMSIALSFGLIAAFGITSYAQQSMTSDKATTQSQTDGMRRGGRHRGTPVFRIMRDLKLSEAQHNQARAILERFKTSIEPQRQALKELHKQREQGIPGDEVKDKAKALRMQIRESLTNTQSELLSILTPEQRSQYDELQQQWKVRRDAFRARRGERRIHMQEKAQPTAPAQ